MFQLIFDLNFYQCILFKCQHSYISYNFKIYFYYLSDFYFISPFANTRQYVPFGNRLLPIPRFFFFIFCVVVVLCFHFSMSCNCKIISLNYIIMLFLCLPLLTTYKIIIIQINTLKIIHFIPVFIFSVIHFSKKTNVTFFIGYSLTIFFLLSLYNAQCPLLFCILS